MVHVSCYRSSEEWRTSSSCCLTFGVPRTTLGDRIRGMVVHGTKCGKLRPRQRATTIRVIVEVGQAGYGKQGEKS